MMDEPKKKIVKIDLGGKDETLFQKLREKLVDAVDRLLDSPIDYQTGDTVRDEAKKFTSLALNFGEEKLKKAGVENQLLLAEIEGKYASAEREKAETRRLDAETRKLMFEQSLRELSFVLKATKALVIGRQGEEAIIMTKQIEAFLEAVEEIKYLQDNISKGVTE